MAVTTTNLGVITAYGDAVAAGYTGTKAEWQTLMASYATVGQQAVDAKNDAVAAKDIAVQKATDASTAAGTATQKANEASASAQSIAQSAAQIAQNTSDISELKEDLKSAIKKSNIGEKYYSVKDNTYLSSTNGSETYYSGWEATDFIPIDSGDSHILYYSPNGNGGRYNAFYNGSKVFISSFFSNKGLNNIAIPSGAVYFRLSASNAIIDGTKVYTGIQREIDSLSTVVRQIGESDKVENCLITRAGVEASTDLWDSTDYIPVFSNGVISFQCFIYGNASLCFFDEDKNILLGIDGNNASSYDLNSNTYVQQANITPPQGTRYVRMCVWKDYASITDLSLSYECKWNDSAERVLDGISKTDEIAKGYSEKKILVLGDSISADAYGNYKKWVTNLIDDGKLKLANVTNSSQHATGFVATSNSSYPNFVTRMEAIADKSTYDLVVVFGGINDFIQNIPLGGESGETDKTVYFKPAVDYFFQYLVNNFTQARICVLLPLRNYNVYPNTAGNKQEVYSQYIHDVAKSYCLPVLNLTEESGFCPFVDSFKQMWTLIPSGYTAPDGTHPNAEYEKKYLAPMIWKFISGLLN